MPSFRFIFLFILLPLLFVGCGSGGYIAKTSKARTDYVHGHYDKALTRYQKLKVRSEDRLLQLMDLGAVEHAAGHYQTSLKYFDEAIDMSLSKEGHQTASKVASMVSSDNQIPYQGENFEKLLLHFYQVLNYIGLNQPADALIEVRRLHTYYDDFFSVNAKSYLQNAAASYVGGLVWEINGLINDAYIDYKTTHRITPDFKPVLTRLVRQANLLGFNSDLKEWQKNNKIENITDAKKGTVIVVIEEGDAPRKSSTEERSNYKVVPVPTYRNVNFDTPPSYQILENNRSIATSTPLYRCDTAARDTLADEKKSIMARAIARLATKESAAVAIGKQVDPGLGALVGLLLLSTNQADIRSWLTLPRSFQIAEFSLTEGDHTLQIKGTRGEKTITVKNLKAKTNQIVMVRVF